MKPNSTCSKIILNILFHYKAYFIMILHIKMPKIMTIISTYGCYSYLLSSYTMWYKHVSFGCLTALSLFWYVTERIIHVYSESIIHYSWAISMPPALRFTPSACSFWRVIFGKHPLKILPIFKKLQLLYWLFPHISALTKTLNPSTLQSVLESCASAALVSLQGKNARLIASFIRLFTRLPPAP